MRAVPRLTVNRHGVYTFRALVPKVLRPALGTAEFKRSLQTKEYNVAKLRCAKLNYEIELRFAKMKKELADLGLTPEDVRELTVKFPNGTSVDLDLDKPAEKSYFDSLATQLESSLLFSDDMQRRMAAYVAESQAVSAKIKAEQQAAPASGLEIREVLEKWRVGLEKRVAASTLKDYLSRVNNLDKFLKTYLKEPGFVRLSQVTKKHAVAYRELLDERVKVQTADGITQVLKNFMDFAIKRAYYEGENPFAGLTELTKARAEEVAENYEPFTGDELRKIFEPNAYAKFNSKPHFFWVPLLALFSGARIEELSQLDIDDIVVKDGIPCIDINDRDDKELKNKASIRIVPIHSRLIELGFLQYVADMRPLGQKKLFPYLTKTVNGYSKTGSAHFGKYLKHLALKTPLKVFHSFRHTYNNEMKQMHVPESARCEIVGHKYESVNDTVYSQKFGLDSLRSFMEMVTYPSIAEYPVYQAGQFTKQVERGVAIKKSRLANRAARQRRQS